MSLGYKIMKHLAELEKLKEKCLEMSDKEFNYCFNKGDTSQRSINTIVARLMNKIGLKEVFFKTDKDYVDWIEDVISARKKAALSPSTPVSMDKKAPDPAMELAKLKEKCLKMEEDEFNYCFNKGNTSERSISTIIARLKNAAGLKEEFFKTDKEYIDWIEDVISTRKKAALSPSTPASMDKKAPDPAMELAKLKEKCLKMEEDEFNYCFNKGNTSERSISTIIARLKNAVDLKEEFFKTDKDYVVWIENVISARKNVPIELAKIKEQLLKMKEGEFDYYVKDLSTNEYNGGISINRRLFRDLGLKGEFFKTQKDYNAWIEDVISARKFNN
ncbi:TPA: hypothetical protein F7051_16985, partial [Legionella pneumophila]|nr:hypothetical protein [Legionella pneumophila]